MRLDKFLSVTGTLTRSESGRAVRAKRVTVNGKVAPKADIQVDPDTDTIALDGAIVIYRKYTYIMLNKPQGYVSSTNDRLPIVLELLPEELRRLSLFPCGRLDKDTEGLMLLTDNGELAHFLLSPVSHVPKTYFYRCEKPLNEEEIGRLEAGVDIGDDKPTKPSALKPDGNTGYITLSEGRYHQIKRMFEAVGNKITYLERIEFGPLKLDPALNRGEWRYLTDEEITELQKHNRNIGENK